MFENNNMMGFNGYQMGGYPPQPGMQYAPRPTAKMTQTLTAEQIKSLRNNGGTFDLNISPEQGLKAICTHKENGNIVLVENSDGTVTCPICGANFTLCYLENNQVEEVVRAVTDVIQSVKTMYLDIPEEMAKNYMMVLPLLEKLPKLYEISRNNFNMYDQSNVTNQTGNMFGFNALNAFASPAFATMPGMMGNGNPAFGMNMAAPMNPGFMPQAGFMPQPGYPQQPVGNPFMYNDPGYQAQVQQNQMQQPPQQAPAQNQNDNQQQTGDTVKQQRVFNV